MENIFPVNPLSGVVAEEETEDYHRRIITGILESYNSNYDVLAETIQNAVDAVEDAHFLDLAAPFEIHVHINLADNWVGVLDTGVGLSQSQVAKAFAPNVSFKTDARIISARGTKYPYRGYKGVGLTFLSYGTNDFVIHSKEQNGELVKGRMRYARAWVMRGRDDYPEIVPDETQSPLEMLSRGTYVRVQLTSPKISEYG